MSFDWQVFLDARGIEYTTRGPSTAKDNLYIHCVFCGDADQGRHMGLSTINSFWGCWRDASHRGRSPVRLIQALLGIGWVEASAIVGQKRATLSNDESTLERMHSMLGLNFPEQKVRKPPIMPKDFRPLLYSKATPHYKYLLNRGYNTPEIKWLAEQFRLHICWAGSLEWMWRLIIPVYGLDNQLITWTGRTVGSNLTRYRSLTPDPEKANGGPVALAAISDCFLDIRGMNKGGEFLTLFEGPFDCMSVALEAGRFNAHADCLFGKILTPAQLDHIATIRHRYNKVFLALDPEERVYALRLGLQLEALGIDVYLLKGKHDPGEMRRDDIRQMLADMQTRSIHRRRA